MAGRIETALRRLEWMHERAIWPNGKRYLWTDAFGVVLLVSLFRATGDKRFLDQAEWVVAEVDRVLGRERGIRIGEAPDRDGQYYHYLAKWIFALTRLGSILPDYRERALSLVGEIHEPFIRRRVGVVWKMKEDLSAPYPGYGLGALDAFDGYVAYRLLDERALAGAIADMREIMELSYPKMAITQDLALGMMLWLCHVYPQEDWARVQGPRCISTLENMWVDPPGYFCREPHARTVRFAFTNYGVSLGLQAVGAMPERVDRLHAFFARYRSGDEYDTEAITHVMACCAYFPGDWLRASWQQTGVVSG
jgi:hypothetical protein